MPVVRTHLALALCLVSAGFMTSSPVQAEDTCGADDALQQFTKLYQDAWEYDLAEDPLWASSVGDHRYDDRLPRVRPADYRRRQKQKQQFQKRLEAIDRASLPAARQVDYDIFRRLLADELAEYRFQSHLIPITGRSGFHISFPELARSSKLDSPEDYQKYIARLAAFGQYAEDHIELMREGIKAGQVLPDVVLRGIDDSLAPHVVDDPTASILFDPFRKLPESFSEADGKRLRKAGQKAIAEGIVPGYAAFLKFVRREYLPAARGSIGASALPQGRDFYRHRVRSFTTLDLTPEQVHQTGLAEVRRIREEMQTVTRRAKFDGDLPAFLKFLRTDPQFYAKTPTELLQSVALILKRMDGQLPQLFGRLPRMPYGIREVPAYIAPRTTSAYYMLPSGDGRNAGFYYLNTYDLKSRPLFEMEALSLHEAVPGHHLQLALQQELEDLPDFRRHAGFTVFIEGWALYAERLGQEVGFYEDPYQDFGRLSFEMWRACRLVVDTGIHYLGWTRQQAIDYLEANTALSMHNITAEVDRYIAWPGQALAYKTGEMRIRQLRALAEKELGEQFDVRAFHDVVLGSGAVPLDVLEANVRAHIKAVKGEN